MAATRSGITPTVRLAPHLQLDIDRPEDLVAFMARESSTRTHAHLAKRMNKQRLRDDLNAMSRHGSSERGRG
jgi:2-phospho-L-lactate guanylyltransferase (CobY/MobA/RfbA family)